MRQSIPLCLLRIWCRKADSWLAFQTRTGDRYVVGARGYFLELPDGSLAPISPRVAFPVIDRFPCLVVSDLDIQAQFGKTALFVTVPASGQWDGKPKIVYTDVLTQELEAVERVGGNVSLIERYIILRVKESGMVPDAELERVIANRTSGQTITQLLLSSGLCGWEPLLAICLDVRAASKLDPPHVRKMIQEKEWELLGETLIAMGTINRTDLERAVKIKREGNQALGQILSSMGACSQMDIEQCLSAQKESRRAQAAGVAAIGQLLVSQGIISPQHLEEALREQRVGRQSLERILISMGACTQRDIDDFARYNGQGFQGSIDDLRLGEWLVKVGTISRSQLGEAYRIQIRGRQVLGELLIAMRLCTEHDIETAIKVQSDIRENYQSGVEKLGSLLLKHGKVDPAQLEQALKLQSTGRQPIGSVLVALGACSSEDVSLASTIQRRWREEVNQDDDRLGILLLRQGIICQDDLNQAMPYHLCDGRPLGRVLIDLGRCTPEEIIDTLISRHSRRHSAFLAFVKASLPKPAVAEPPAMKYEHSRKTQETDLTLLKRLSALILKPPKQG